MKSMVYPLISIVGILIFLLFAVGFVDYVVYLSEKEECKEYSDWGYVTEFDGRYSFFKDSAKCLIFMEDGTKLPLELFKTVSVKNAMIGGLK